MDQHRIKEILGKIEQTRVAVYGDFCIDAYWMLDPKGSEVSEETGLQARAVRRHYYSLGGASNVVANLAALKPKSIQVIGVIGNDIFGRELRRQFEELGVDTTHLVVQNENYDTVAFGKPYLDEREEPRIDFGFFNRRSVATDAALLEGIREALRTADAMIVNQQVPGSITNESFIEQANRLFAQCPDKPILLDSRHFGDRFKHIIRKINDREAARLNGVQVAHDENPSLDDVKRYAQTLYGWFNKPVFLTRGSRGMLAVDGQGVHQVPGIQLLKKLDPVGAGDTVTSALALCLGAGVPAAEAAEFANFAAAVTVQKLFQTGTANGDEILAVAKDPDFIYQPELAESPRKARYLPGTEIEICDDGFARTDTDRYRPAPTAVRHAVFDNDGTISTLRQGWEAIMAPVMIRAILGDRCETADETLYRKVRERVLDFIDKSTGIQTIVQMEGLVGMVREFGIVPPEKVLDRFGYKRIYNDALMEMVSLRLAKLKRGQLGVDRLHRQGRRRVSPGLARSRHHALPGQRHGPRRRGRRSRGSGTRQALQRRHLRRRRRYRQLLQEDGPRSDPAREQPPWPGTGRFRRRARRAARVSQTRRLGHRHRLRRSPSLRLEPGQTHPPDQGRRSRPGPGLFPAGGVAPAAFWRLSDLDNCVRSCYKQFRCAPHARLCVMPVRCLR